MPAVRALGVMALAIGASLAAHAPREERPRPPAPELPVPGAELAEARVDAIPPGDRRRPELLLDLALRRHAEAEALEGEERRAHREALVRWREAAAARDAAAREPPPALATPRADARRSEAVRLAERALEEASALHVALHGEEGRPDSGSSFRGEAEALLVAGIDAERIGRAKDALRMLGALVRRFPASPLVPDAWLALGEHHLGERDLTRARAAYEVAARTGGPEVSGWAAARLAEVALEAGDAEGAVGAVGSALEAGSPQGLVALDRLAAAPEALAAAPDALERLAELCDRTGDVGRALALRERLAREAPRAPAAVRARTEAARARRAMAPVGEPPRLPGGGALRAAPTPDAAWGDPRIAAFAGEAGALHALGRAALEAGRVGEARLVLERAAADPGASGALEAAVENDLAVALLALGDGAGARSALERATARGGLPVAAENLGAVALALGDPAAAEPELERAVAQEPARWQARLLHAEALAALGRAAAALAEAERVLDLERGQGDALQLAAGLRERLARESPACPPAEGCDKVSPGAGAVP
jgi:tetratricopeptide (TPR) repeat protein